LSSPASGSNSKQHILLPKYSSVGTPRTSHVREQIVRFLARLGLQLSCVGSDFGALGIVILLGFKSVDLSRRGCRVWLGVWFLICHGGYMAERKMIYASDYPLIVLEHNDSLQNCS